LTGLARTLALEGARYNITCNAIVPGVIATEAYKMGRPDMNERMVKRIAMRRPGEPDDIANAITFLCSPAAGYITGVALPVSRRSQAAFTEIEHFSKPLIAAINGHALGGGCELALACDYRLMIDDGRSTIGQTEANLGLIPGAGGTQRLPRLVGRGRATELIFESIRLKAPEAAGIGLITTSLAAEGFQEAVLMRARRLARAAPIALRLAKEALLAGLERPPGKGYEVEAENFGRAAMTEDAMVGIMSFVGKQQPEFKGK